MESELEECQKVIAALGERIEKHDSNRREVQESLHGICDGLRRQIDEMERRVGLQLEEEYTKEDARLQAALGDLQECVDAMEDEEADSKSNNKDLIAAAHDAGSELLVMQTYELAKRQGEGQNPSSPSSLSALYELKTVRQMSLEWVWLKRPTIHNVLRVSQGKVYLEISGGAPSGAADEEAVAGLFAYRVLLYRDSEADGVELAAAKEDGGANIYSVKPEVLESDTAYRARAKVTFNGRASEWSAAAEFGSPASQGCVWKRCPEGVGRSRRYAVEAASPRVATKVHGGSGYSTIVGSTALGRGRVASWHVRVLRSLRGDGGGILTGAAPFDVSQDDDGNFVRCGWYLNCYTSTLFSGPPHGCKDVPYGPRRPGKGEYVRAGDAVGVVADTAKGTLSFVVGGVSYGAAFVGIPLDRPLVPCTLVWNKGDAVELDPAEVRENVSYSAPVPVPSNITAKSKSWDTITLIWDGNANNANNNNNNAGDAFYQVEFDGDGRWCTSVVCALTMGRLLPGTEHSFRVRAVRRGVVSEWSGAVRGRTQDVPAFSESVWKECPEGVGGSRRYAIDAANPRVATKSGGGRKGCCTLVGTTPFPPGKATAWGAKVLAPGGGNNNGSGVFVGVAPFDIGQDDEDNLGRCGWYLSCLDSTLWSGPPHGCRKRAYGPRRNQGEYVRTGDTVGVVMDTTCGEVSFILDGEYLGPAYTRVPPDKPLVPCVLLYCDGASVELITTSLEKEVITF